MVDRRKDLKTRGKVEDALQRRDIDDLNKGLLDLAAEMKEGFQGVHDRQDYTNGKVTRASEDIVELKNWQSFFKGGLAVLTVLVVPVLIYIITHFR